MNTPEETHVNSNRLTDQAEYDPNHLLDSLIEKLHLKNDAALSRVLEVAPPVISKIRHRRLPVGASLLIRMHEVSDQIGRASCRERVCQYGYISGAAGTLKKKKTKT